MYEHMFAFHTEKGRASSVPGSFPPGWPTGSGRPRRWPAGCCRCPPPWPRSSPTGRCGGGRPPRWPGSRVTAPPPWPWPSWPRRRRPGAGAPRSACPTRGSRPRPSSVSTCAGWSSCRTPVAGGPRRRAICWPGSTWSWSARPAGPAGTVARHLAARARDRQAALVVLVERERGLAPGRRPGPGAWGRSNGRGSATGTATSRGGGPRCGSAGGGRPARAADARSGSRPARRGGGNGQVDDGPTAPATDGCRPGTGPAPAPAPALRRPEVSRASWNGWSSSGAPPPAGGRHAGRRPGDSSGCSPAPGRSAPGSSRSGSGSAPCPRAGRPASSAVRRWLCSHLVEAVGEEARRSGWPTACSPPFWPPGRELIVPPGEAAALPGPLVGGRPGAGPSWPSPCSGSGSPRWGSSPPCPPPTSRIASGPTPRPATGWPGARSGELAGLRDRASTAACGWPGARIPTGVRAAALPAGVLRRRVGGGGPGGALLRPGAGAAGGRCRAGRPAPGRAGPVRAAALVPWGSPEAEGRPGRAGACPLAGAAAAALAHRVLGVPAPGRGGRRRPAGPGGERAGTAQRPSVDRLSVEGGPWQAVAAWAGPWPVTERWWSARRRRARLQVVMADGTARLLVSRTGAVVGGGGL